MSLDPTALVGPALFAGVVAIGATVAIERLGGRIGGVLGTLPTTIVPAAWGIWSQSHDANAFREAMAAVPVGMAINGMFLWTWRTLPPRLPDTSLEARLAMMVGASLGTWALVALAANSGLAWLITHGINPLFVGLTALVMLGGAGIAACWHPPPAPAGKRPVPLLGLLARGAMSAAAIAACVVVASTGASVASGLASVFPAIFLTAMVSLWYAQGEAVPVGAVGPMILGSTSVSAYALLAAWTMPWWPLGGAVMSWVIAVALTSVPATAFLRRRRRELDLP